MSNDGWGLVVPFLNDSPDFAYGVQIGMLYEQMKTASEVRGLYQSAIQDQILLMANRLGWTVNKVGRSKDGWFDLEMRAPS